MPELAVILAAGLGSRMKSSAGGKPKGFVEIGGTPIIERSIQILHDHGIRRILIGTGHRAEFYESLARRLAGVETVFNPIYQASGSFFTLYNMKDRIREDFLLLESDLLYEGRAVTALCRDTRENVILASGKTESGDEVYIETDTGGQLVNMSKRKSDLNRIDGELVGITRICADAFHTMVSLYKENEAETRRIEYETALIRLARAAPVHVMPINDLAWAEIDTEDHLRRAKEMIFPLVTQQ